MDKEERYAAEVLHMLGEIDRLWGEIEWRCGITEQYDVRAVANAFAVVTRLWLIALA